MHVRLRTLLILMALGPPAVGIIWVINDEAVSHRISELLLIFGALSVFLFTLYPLTLAAAWTVDVTAGMISNRHKR